jgi:hypothetical protein
MDDIIRRLRETDPFDTEAVVAIGIEGLKEAVKNMPGIPTYGYIGFVGWDETTGPTGLAAKTLTTSRIPTGRTSNTRRHSCGLLVHRVTLVDFDYVTLQFSLGGFPRPERRRMV